MNIRPTAGRVADTIASGLRVRGASLESALTIDVAEERRNDRGWPAAMVAARIVGAEFNGEVGLWAISGDAVSPGPVFALNAVAREWSSWGEVAQPGSRATDIIERLTGYPEAREIVAAVRG